MQGLLSNPVISGLLSGGPNAVRAMSQQQVAQMLPRGGGGMMGAPSPIVQSGGGMGAGLAGLGEGLQKFAQMRKEQAAQEQAKSSLEKVLGLQSGGEAIAENVSMGGQPGPTQAAAQRQDPNPMKLPAGIVQAARMAYDAGDYTGGINLIQKGLTASPGARRIIKGADGKDYYEDTKEPVLPGVEAPAKPKETREINQGGNVVTQEWDGQRWITIAQAPRFQPRAPTQERYTLYKNGKGQEVGVGTKTEQTLLNSGWTLNPSDSPLPGRDIPLPEAVADQKAAIARAGAGMNEGQSKAAGFADRMAAADAVINSMASKEGTDLYNRIVAGIPLAGNYLVSEEFKQFDQAKRDFVNAILRRESGAVISDQEFDNADKQYFPQPGDGPAVIAQKAANRARATLGIMRAAGPNYEPEIKPSKVPSPSEIPGNEAKLQILIDKYAGEQ